MSASSVDGKGGQARFSHVHIYRWVCLIPPVAYYLLYSISFSRTIYFSIQ